MLGPSRSPWALHGVPGLRVLHVRVSEISLTSAQSSHLLLLSPTSGPLLMWIPLPGQPCPMHLANPF